MADESLDEPMALYWLPGKKPQAMQQWGENVMGDVRTTRTELKAAWALSFAFNDQDARAWPTHETLGRSAGLSAEAIRAGIRGLVRNGHLIRREEKINGKMMVVSRPTFNSRVVKGQPPRSRKGGRPSTTALVEGLPVRVVDPQPPCIPDLSLIDQRDVEGFMYGGGTEEFHDQEDWDCLPP